jgi:hypothetical protein
MRTRVTRGAPLVDESRCAVSTPGMRPEAPIQQPLPEWPEWMDLKSLVRYSSLSNRTLRSCIRASENPLPASTLGGKILVSRRAFDNWMKEQAVKLNSVDVERIVTEILESL